VSEAMETIIEETDVVDLPEAEEAEDVGLGKEEQKHQFVVLRTRGYSYARIAGELGVSKGTLTAWNAELEAEVAKARAVELEALQEEFFLLKEGRIRLIGEQLKAIQAEIGKRDLSQVNTDKLLELQLRYFGELKGEYVETGPRTKTGPKLNSSDIAGQLQAVLQSMLKAVEQAELAAKLERLEGIVQARR
jgi:transposase-like protein